ncbi:MAG TPA: MBL fold metallo-hydrolase [Euryarchaeota archaeon]|nr:MBL fold metallo-hydrolase [Euryarchaeota archaeon]
MEIAFLGSSSSGNSTLICSDETDILIDAGLSARAIEHGLSILGKEPRDIDAVLISHEHSDHCRGAGILSRKYGVKVMANLPTFAMAPIGNVLYSEFATMTPFAIGDLTVNSYPVPHNAAEPVCFTVDDGTHDMGFATDLGKVTALIAKALFDRNLLVIEANHDEEMLWNGRYPAFLKKSISSPNGHLSNRDSAKAATELVTEKTQAVVLAHLSEDNNTPEKAAHEVRSHLARKCVSKKVISAERRSITPYISLR